MKRFIAFVILIISTVILTSCSPNPPTDLKPEGNLKEYLVGDWVCSMEYVSDKVIYMNITEDLDICLSFINPFTDEIIKDYKGKIVFDRLYAKSSEPPDLLGLELNDEEYSQGDFFFLHRTTYDNKQVLSLFYAGNGDSVFNNLAEEEIDGYFIEDVMFEKEIKKQAQGEIRKNDGFYAVFWGKDDFDEGVWLDDVLWTPSEKDDFTDTYPRAMTAYENDEPVSEFYKIASNKKSYIFGDDLFKGGIYYIETDKKGNVINLIAAEYKKYLEETIEDIDENIDSDIAALVFDIITKEDVTIQEKLDTGMSILYTGEKIIIDGNECYEVILGTNHSENFVREIYYAVDVVNKKIYEYDVINDLWK